MSYAWLIEGVQSLSNVINVRVDSDIKIVAPQDGDYKLMDVYYGRAHLDNVSYVKWTLQEGFFLEDGSYRYKRKNRGNLQGYGLKSGIYVSNV